MPATLSRRLPAPLFRLPAPGRKAARRTLAFGLLALGVAWGHREASQAVAGWLARPAARDAIPASRPGAVQLLPPTQPPTPGHAAPGPRLAALPLNLPRAPAARPAAAAAMASPTRQPLETAPASAQAPSAEPPPGAPTLPTAIAPPGAAAQWPQHPTRPPPAATLQFRLQRGALSGLGRWQWAPDGPNYQLHLQADLAGRPLLDQHSQGSFDTAGLAPQRMVERQHGRAVRAVNFQRDKGLISFSGSTQSWALAAGAQDRVSWLPQLMALVAGRAGAWPVGADLVLPVAGPRGDLDLWTFQLQDMAELQGQPALHWQRLPARPYDARIDLWLATAAPHWPLAWQWQVLPGGEPVRWERLAATEPTADP